MFLIVSTAVIMLVGEELRKAAQVSIRVYDIRVVGGFRVYGIRVVGGSRVGEFGCLHVH